MIKSITWAKRRRGRALQVFANFPLTNSVVAAQHNRYCIAMLLYGRSIHLEAARLYLGRLLVRRPRLVLPNSIRRLFP